MCPRLLLLSAAALVVADVERWGDVCGWRDRHDPPCVGRQDHRYDYTPAFAPWEPVGADGWWGAAALALLALGLGAACLVVGRTRTGVLEGVCAVVVVVVVGSQAALTLGSASVGAGIDAEQPGWEVVVAVGIPAWAFLVPAVLVLPALLRFGDDAAGRSPPGSGSGLVAALLMATASPLGWMVVPSLVSGASYDTPPWDGVVIAVLLVGAALLLLRVRRPEARHGPAQAATSERSAST